MATHLSIRLLYLSQLRYSNHSLFNSKGGVRGAGPSGFVDDLYPGGARDVVWNPASERGEPPRSGYVGYLFRGAVGGAGRFGEWYSGWASGNVGRLVEIVGSLYPGSFDDILRGGDEIGIVRVDEQSEFPVLERPGYWERQFDPTEDGLVSKLMNCNPQGTSPLAGGLRSPVVILPSLRCCYA